MKPGEVTKVYLMCAEHRTSGAWVPLATFPIDTPRTQLTRWRHSQQPEPEHRIVRREVLVFVDAAGAVRYLPSVPRVLPALESPD